MLPLKASGSSGSGSNGNEEVLYIPQTSKTGASPSDDSMSYSWRSLGGVSYIFAEIQSVYSTAQAEWVKSRICTRVTESLSYDDNRYTVLVEFYGISTSVGYLKTNPFLYI